MGLIKIDGTVVEWFEAAPSILVGVLILFLPGTVAGLFLRVKVFDAIALSPLLSVTVISLAAIIGPRAGLSWSPLTFALGVLVLWVVAFAGRYLLSVNLRGVLRARGTADPQSVAALHQLPTRGRRTVQADNAAEPRGAAVYYFATALVAFLIIGTQVIRIFGSPDSFSQTFDNIFHLNAVRYVLDTGDASSLTLTSMTTAGQPPYFYPAAWHGFVALIIQASSVPVTVGVTSANLLVAALIWPLSCLFAVRQLARLTRPAILGAGAVLAGFSAFPILLLDFGVLYPNLLSLAMVPAGLALFAAVLGQAPHSTLPRRTVVVLSVLALPGIAVAHPNGALTLLVLGLPVVASLYAGLMSKAFHQRAWLRALAYTAGLAIFLWVVSKIWAVVRPPAAAALWDRVETSSQALGEALLNAPFERPAAWVVSILVVVGVVAAVRRPTLRWLAGSFGVAVGVFIVAAGFEFSPLRSYITGVWYNDPYRLAAVLPIVAAPLAVLGLGAAGSALFHRISPLIPANRRGALASHSAAAGVGLVLLLLLIPGVVQNRAMAVAVDSARLAYEVSAESALVSSDELALIEELDEHVPADATIAVNPWTGGAVAYALSGRDTTYKHTLSNSSDENKLIDNHLKDGLETPGVCEAADEEEVEYVLDFGVQEVHGGNHRYPGIENLENDRDFELVTAQGSAKLFKFIGC
ncbi:DUF6541 family protein [Arthrobacter sp. TMN-37]